MGGGGAAGGGGADGGGAGRGACLNTTAGGSSGAIGAAGSRATGATGEGAGALDEGLPMRTEVSGWPLGPNRPVTDSGTSIFLCPARRGNCSGFNWERISAKGNSTGAWSWSLASANTPAG